MNIQSTVQNTMSNQTRAIHLAPQEVQEKTVFEEFDTRDVLAGAAGGLALGTGGAWLGGRLGFEYGFTLAVNAPNIDSGFVKLMTGLSVGALYSGIGAIVGGATGGALGVAGGVAAKQLIRANCAKG